MPPRKIAVLKDETTPTPSGSKRKLYHTFYHTASSDSDEARPALKRRALADKTAASNSSFGITLDGDDVFTNTPVKHKRLMLPVMQKSPIKVLANRTPTRSSKSPNGPVLWGNPVDTKDTHHATVGPEVSSDGSSQHSVDELEAVIAHFWHALDGYNAVPHLGMCLLQFENFVNKGKFQKAANLLAENGIYLAGSVLCISC